MVRAFNLTLTQTLTLTLALTPAPIMPRATNKLNRYILPSGHLNLVKGNYLPKYVAFSYGPKIQLIKTSKITRCSLTTTIKVTYQRAEN